MEQRFFTAARGAARLTQPAALPCTDTAARTGYMGSIARDGSNADWDWQIYRNSRGEWVLFEAFGPGCIYNFTQHRYPTSEEPVFSFYFDDEETPAFSICPKDFGKKAPFLSLLADIYEGPEEGGRGPIWVVRSFVPMEFTRYCRVVSSIPLTGNDKARGEGGWGHVTYTLYDTAAGLHTFSPTASVGELLRTVRTRIDAERLPAVTVGTAQPVIFRSERQYLPGHGSLNVAEHIGPGTVTRIRIRLDGPSARRESLSQLRLRLTWDGAAAPAVDAPIGTFFGGEYPDTACAQRWLLLRERIVPSALFEGENCFPMPFWRQMKAELYTVGNCGLFVDWELELVPECLYDPQTAGYFTASAYYEKTPCTAGKNSPIGTLEGTGHMVYGVLSGQDIRCGCEGDVRVFLDGRRSPEIESDGSESWASYGWGFVTPPQCNPFSGYNGLPMENGFWSELRLTVTDSYHFRQQLRFELEHGCCNDGMGSHSGQVFAYLLGQTRNRFTDEVLPDDPADAAVHGFDTAVCRAERLVSGFADGTVEKDTPTAGTVYTPLSPVTLRLRVDAANRGVVLHRRSSQRQGRQLARVLVDGVPIRESLWYAPSDNPYYSWLDDSYLLPAAYTAGKDVLTVTLEPLGVDGAAPTWNAASIRVLCLL